MGRIEITTEPHELIVDGTTILMQADPTAGKEWDTLMETPYAVGNNGRTELMTALAALAETPNDSETLTKLDLGGPTLNLATGRYIEMVTGFPILRHAISTASSKKTGDTSGRSSRSKG